MTETASSGRANGHPDLSSPPGSGQAETGAQTQNQAPAQTPTAQLANRTLTSNRWLVLVIACLAQFMVVLDATIVNVALPSIQRGPALLALEPAVGRQRLHAGLRRIPAARRARRRPARPEAHVPGRHRCCSRAPRCSTGSRRSSEMLIVGRGLQGLGGALLSPAALSIITTTFTDHSERTKALGVWSAIAAGGGAVGLMLGGVAHRAGVVAVDLLRQRPGRASSPSSLALALRPRVPGRTSSTARSTSPAQSPSPRAWSCSCTRSSRRSRSAGARRARSD